MRKKQLDKEVFSWRSLLLKLKKFKKNSEQDQMANEKRPALLAEFETCWRPGEYCFPYGDPC